MSKRAWRLCRRLGRESGWNSL